MERMKVESSQIASIGYDPAAQKLHLEFTPPKGKVTGSVYEYANVPQAIYDGFFLKDDDGNQRSIGRYFGSTIKPNKELYPYTRIAEPQE